MKVEIFDHDEIRVYDPKTRYDLVVNTERCGCYKHVLFEVPDLGGHGLVNEPEKEWG